MTEGLLREGRDNEAGRCTSVQKLNGQVYTPLQRATQMLAQVHWPAGDGVLLDPACGDGVFLEAAARKWLDSGRPAAALTEHLVGWDLDAGAITAARSRLEALGVTATLTERDALDESASRYEVVVGNPPYLEAKRMPDALKNRVRRVAPLAAHGAFDLYAAFVERAHALADEVCFLIPNRFLVVAAAEKLRDHLLRECDVSVVDLSTEAVFSDAAVYPIVLHTRRAARPRYRVGLEPPVTLDATFVRGRLRTMMPTAPTDPAGKSLFERLLEYSPLQEVADVRWTVSFHRAGLREEFVFETRPDSPHARRFLGGGRFAGNREVQPGRIEWRGGFIDYDEARARAANNPLPPLALFDRPKVVVCQNARRGRAAVDREGFVLKDTFLAVQPTRVSPEWIALVVNSRLFHYLYEHLYAGTRKAGGYLHYLARYLGPFPLAGEPTGADAVYETGDLAAADRFVEDGYGVTAPERRVLDAYDFPKH